MTHLIVQVSLETVKIESARASAQVFRVSVTYDIGEQKNTGKKLQCYPK